MSRLLKQTKLSFKYADQMNVKKIFITIGLLIILEGILRESGILDMNLYKTNSNTSIKSNWSNKNATATFDSLWMGTTSKNELFCELPVVVLYQKDTLFNENSTHNYIVVTIDTFETDFLWPPLYKPVTLNVTANVEFLNNITKTHPASITLIQANVTGQLKLKGSVEFVGFCSYYQASKKVKELVAEMLVKETKQYFSTLD